MNTDGTTSWNISTTLAPTTYGNDSSAFTTAVAGMPPSRYSTPSTITIVILALTASLITSCGNVLVISSFCFYRSLRTINNYLILNLAIADLSRIIGMYSMNVYTVYLVQGGWYMGNFACNVWLGVDYVASNASVLNLLIICIDRYLSVNFPVKYRNHRKLVHVKIAMALTWIISAILWGPWVLWQMVDPKQQPAANKCYVKAIFESAAIGLATSAGAFYVPAIAMMFLYAKVYMTIAARKNNLQNAVISSTVNKLAKDATSPVKTSSIKISDEQDSKGTMDLSDEPSQISNVDDSGEKEEKEKKSFWSRLASKKDASSTAATPQPQKPQYGRQLKSLKKESRATRLLAAIIFVFISLWAPYNILVVYASLQMQVPEIAWELSYWLCYLNRTRTLNPVCYAACNPAFRSAFIAILTCSKRVAK
ncbi:Oidioi.mRNA.OKI2018_I69.PAR.g8657.t1.cds [Oikopleura dioica]|uniref:Oidioi.mRNA.OKI2018_I69.PAR.g8657.t1.cds n=1 Tax=Oikopleura dioica TaxID=34765 RepID=A0ABN7RGZ9_OIKDI|nr:Oidioi.mRNA.OKI2018_I69.PAR.g8657.t1.cds [Oikopleura dioica]